LVALPDYPVLKNDISDVLYAVLERSHTEQIGPLARSPRTSLVEGQTANLVDQNGAASELDERDYRSEELFDLAELPNLTHQDIVARVAAIGADLGRKFREHASQQVMEVAQPISGVLTSDGTFDARILLSAIESIELGFDADGTPHPIEFLGSATASADLTRRMYDFIAEHEDVRSAYEEIIERKRNDWNSRQASRELAD